MNNAHPQRRIEGAIAAIEQDIEKDPNDPQKVTIWCALLAEGTIVPYYFKDEAGYNVIVNRECYRTMINDFFEPKLENVDVDDLWFQEGGAKCHTSTNHSIY